MNSGVVEGCDRVSSLPGGCATNPRDPDLGASSHRLRHTDYGGARSFLRTSAICKR